MKSSRGSAIAMSPAPPAPARARPGRRGPAGVRAALFLTALVAAAAAAAAAEPPSSSSSSGRGGGGRALLQRSGFYNRPTDYNWRQTDMSVRNEQQTQMVLMELRRRSGGDAARANAVSTALLGTNSERGGQSVRTRNNLNMNLARYARPGQGGALGAVYRRINPRTFTTGDRDTDFRNNAWNHVATSELRRAGAARALDARRDQQRARGAAAAAPGGGGGNGGFPRSRVPSAAFERAAVVASAASSYKRELTDESPDEEAARLDGGGGGGGGAGGGVGPEATAGGRR
jgi:hypothetical protein